MKRNTQEKMLFSGASCVYFVFLGEFSVVLSGAAQ